MPSVMFQTRFADLVESGKKRQTIRRARKRPIRVGDRLSLRRWAGAAYRSKQIVLCEVTCERVAVIHIEPRSVAIDGVQVANLDAFGLAEGFGNWGAMVEWLRSVHWLPFDGVLIAWSVPYGEFRAVLRSGPSVVMRFFDGRIDL